MPDTKEQAPAEQAEAPVSLKEALEAIPPGNAVPLTALGSWVHNPRGGNNYRDITLPELSLYCPTKGTCEGIRMYRASEAIRIEESVLTDKFLYYKCKNCGASGKVFAVRLYAGEKPGENLILKLGETPMFGPPTPPRVTRLLGRTDGDLFLKGRSCENQGHGIAAYAYYRRVIESQKDTLFDEIIRVSKALNASPELIRGLEEGKSQVQFTSAIEQVSVALPESLLINGYNPITLLHAALSSHLHSGTDADCLRSATDARVVLTELVKRLAEAMKEDRDLKSAVSRLARHKENLSSSDSNLTRG